MRRGKNCGIGAPWLRGRLCGGGYRLTVPRQAIMDVLSHTSKHLSAEEVYLAVHKNYPRIGLTTVYRTLEILVSMGVVFKFDFGDRRARYELADSQKGEEHHHHLVCTRCKRIIEYREFIDEEKELLTRTEKGLARKYNFVITNHLIQFYGLCNECNGGA